MTLTVSRESADAFRTFGFVVLRQYFEPGPLAAEVDRVLADGSCRATRWADRTVRPRHDESAAADAALVRVSETHG